MLEINGEWRIVTDSGCLNLQKGRKVVDKKSKNYGNTQWNTIGYYSKLTHVFERLAEEQILVCDDFAATVAAIGCLQIWLEKNLSTIDEKLLGN